MPFSQSQAFFQNVKNDQLFSAVKLNFWDTFFQTLKIFNIETFSDKENIGIWHEENGIINKVAAIGVRVKKWIAYHGFAINIDNNIDQYKKLYLVE